MMIYVITDKCCECGSCEPFCQIGGIAWVDGRYVIDRENCIGCGVCLEYCPIDDAIIPVEVEVNSGFE